MLLISYALYARRTSHVSGITRFSLKRLPFDSSLTCFWNPSVRVLVLAVSKRIQISYRSQLHQRIDLQRRLPRHKIQNVQRVVTCMTRMTCMRLIQRRYYCRSRGLFVQAVMISQRYTKVFSVSFGMIEFVISYNYFRSHFARNSNQTLL